MFCKHCGKFTAFKSVCSDCKIQLDQIDKGTLWGGSTVLSKDGYNIFKKEFRLEKTMISININGKEQKIDMSKGITNDILNQLASDNNLSSSAIEKILKDISQVIPNIDQKATEQSRVVNGPIKYVACPKCGQKLAKSNWCIYCGHEFVESSTNEVDKQFLQAEVKQEKQEEPQQVQDSYKNRLKGI